MSETCTVLFQDKLEKLAHLFGFIIIIIHCFISNFSLFLVYIMDMTLHFRKTYVENKLALKTVTAVQKVHRKKFVFRVVLWRIYLYKSC